jgi:hypothetical protein
MKIGQNGIATTAIVTIVVIAVVVIVGVSAAVLLAPKEGGEVTPISTTSTTTTLPTTSPTTTTTTTPTGGLQLVFKDAGLPEVKHLQPTIKEIQLQHEDGEWKTIWSDPDGTMLTLTADGAELVLATVSLEAGTYVGTRLFVTTIGVEADVNRDGDTLDTNVEVVVPIGTLPPPDGGMEELEQINALIAQITNLTDTMNTLVAQLEEMGVSPPGEGPPPEGLSPEAQALIDQIDGIRTQIDGLIAQINELTGGSEPPRVEGGLIYTGNYLDEKFTENFERYILPGWEGNYVYDGSSGTILYDLTLHPLEPRGYNISIKVSTTP